MRKIVIIKFVIFCRALIYMYVYMYTCKYIYIYIYVFLDRGASYSQQFPRGESQAIGVKYLINTLYCIIMVNSYDIVMNYIANIIN